MIKVKKMVPKRYSSSAPTASHLKPSRFYTEISKIFFIMLTRSLAIPSCQGDSIIFMRISYNLREFYQVWAYFRIKPMTTYISVFRRIHKYEYYGVFQFFFKYDKIRSSVFYYFRVRLSRRILAYLRLSTPCLKYAKYA